MEIEILTKEESFLKTIDFNFEPLKTEIKTSLEKYKNLNYDDHQIREAKVDRANLNKFKDALDTKRKDIKKKCLIPYDAFEKQIKELISFVDEPILTIDTQIKSFEERKKDERKQALQNHYEQHCKKICEIMPFENLLDTKWLNSSISLQTSIQSLLEKVIKIEADLKAITELNSEFEVTLKDKYLKTLNLSSVILENTRLFEAKTKLQTKPVEPNKTETKNEIKTTTNEPLVMICFKAIATKDQLLKLRDFMKNNEITFERA
ncbi:MAG: hypothetical protein BWY78_01166 [Alphaproteobacteria bacterium ADurb.Bin438]|nr:MAG: hypothetical protein BWY78_01166 [Alphaproteobacteria bacterium ADurb.Bin438]